MRRGAGGSIRHNSVPGTPLWRPFHVLGAASVTGPDSDVAAVGDAVPAAAPVAAAVCYDPLVPSNIEIKAKLRDREAVEALIRSRADQGPELIVQEDVFFACESGRLKLRAFSDDRGELIFYRRLDTEGPAQSDFIKAPTTDPDALATALKAALGEVGTVRKRRTLYLVGQTRIHLDEVDGLGDWFELEVVLEPGQSAGDGERIARDLMLEFGILEDDLEARAYVDLLNSEF
jgi:predicted adenylyl cyclase CyaB